MSHHSAGMRGQTQPPQVAKSALSRMRLQIGSQRQDALGFHVAGTPVLVIEAVDAYAAAAAAGSMDELVIADVDAGVADATATAVVEEHHVTRLQLVTLDHRRVEICLLYTSDAADE